MVWLFAEILLWLLLAFLVGGITGWFFSAVGARRRHAELEQSSTTAKQRLIAEREAERKARLEAAEQVPVLERSLNERGELISKLEAEVAELADLKKQQPEQQVEFESQRARLVVLQTRLESEQTKHAKTRDALTAAEKSVDIQRVTLATEETRLRESQIELQQCETLIAEQAEELAAVNRHLPTLEARLAEYEQRTSNELGSVEESLRVAREELIDWRRRCERLQREIAAADKAASATNGRPAAPEWLCEGPPEERDNLKALRGIGPVLEQRLNELGIYRYEQLARMSDTDSMWVAMHLKTLPDRIERDGWVEQAQALLTPRAGGAGGG